MFMPKLIMEHVSDVTIELLEEKKIKAVILDVDNTLTQHGSQGVEQSVLDWLEYMNSNKMPLMIVSNNYHKRVKPFADKLGLDFECFGMKPFSKGLRRASKRLGVNPHEIALVGDQIYTDVLGGNRLGMYTILVTLIKPETSFFFKLKRFLEKSHINRYYKKENSKKV